MDDGWTHRFPDARLVERDDWIVGKAAGRTVLHVGAADSPFHVAKASSGTLLQQALERVGKSVLGVDTDEGAVGLLRRDWGLNVVAGDFTSPAWRASSGPWQAVLLCDVLEHVMDPGRLVAAAARNVCEGGEVIVTTVNGVSLRAALRSLMGREAVHPDHVAYFSLSTLGRLLERSGLRVCERVTFCYPARSRVAERLLKSVASWKPLTAEGIGVVARR